MAKQKYKFSQHVSPVVEAKYAWLDKPQEGFKPGDKAKYKVRGLMEDTEANREFCAGVIEQALKEAKEAGVRLAKVYHVPFIYPEDVDEEDFVPEEGKNSPKYDEDHRGKIIFNTASQIQPGLIDTKKVSLPDDVKIYGGDLVRVKFTASPYKNGSNSGITLYVNTVQLVEKNTSFSGSGAPDTGGFDDIDGYTADPEEDEEKF